MSAQTQITVPQGRKKLRTCVFQRNQAPFFHSSAVYGNQQFSLSDTRKVAYVREIVCLCVSSMSSFQLLAQALLLEPAPRVGYGPRTPSDAQPEP